MKIYIVQMECGDYYCKGEHIIGVYTVPDVAEMMRAKAKEEEPRWLMDGEVTEFELDPETPLTYNETM